jgi:2-methylisocitrate lyase-like PEP mutase family enzyme
MSATHAEKAAKFYELHQRPGVFLIPNPWDTGSARILAQSGFESLATSSAAAANALGRRDGRMTRDEALAHARAIVAATDLPVSADLENGFGDSPEVVAETIRMAAATGLAGASIEDASNGKESALYDINHAAERVAAAVEAARVLPFKFTLTARAENYVRGKPDLDDTIKRLLAYEKAGADVLFAPGLPDLAAVRKVCSAVSRPVNFAVAIRGKAHSVAELADAGVKRISFAASLYRVAMSGFVEAVQEIKNKGTFTYLDRTMTTSEFNRFLPD